MQDLTLLKELVKLSYINRRSSRTSTGHHNKFWKFWVINTIRCSMLTCKMAISIKLPTWKLIITMKKYDKNTSKNLVIKEKLIIFTVFINSNSKEHVLLIQLREENTKAKAIQTFRCWIFDKWRNFYEKLRTFLNKLVRNISKFLIYSFLNNQNFSVFL